MLNNHLPYNAEVDAEVVKEYQSLHEEKHKVRLNYDRKIEAVYSRMSDL